MMPMEPAPAPSLWSWFAGGSIGYLNDFEEEFYSIHVGAEKFSGETSHAIFLEVGYAEYDETIFGTSVDIDFVPVTLNYKFERPLTGNINWYAGVGAGALFIDADAGGFSDDDTVFTGQAFLGLVWNISDRFEIFGGGRWIYLDGGSFSDSGESVDTDSDDDILGELGLRFNF